MKIALYHNLTSGGSKREAYEFARQFVQHGHIVDVYCPATANEDFLPLEGIARRTVTVELKYRDNTAGRMPLLRKYRDLWILEQNLAESQRVAEHLAGQIDAQHYDFVFVHHDQPVQSPYLLRYLKTPSVYYCAEPMREFYEPPIVRTYQQPHSRAARWQQRWYAPAKWLERRTIQNHDFRNAHAARLLLTNSHFSAESIYRAYGLRARVVYLGADAEKFRPLDLAREEFVLSVGAISPLKGYDFLVKALGCVAEELRPALILVGNTASQGEVRLLEQLALAHNVSLQIRVNVSDEDLVRLYNRARAFVYAPIMEPFGFAPLEAMGCETPVVAVREGGVRESVQDGETGLLTEREPQLFAMALTRVLTDMNRARCLGESGRKRVLAFWTWEHAFQRLLESIGAIKEHG